MAIRHQAFLFRLEPDEAQEVLFAKSAGCSRYVYNRCLDLKSEAWTASQTKLTFVDLANLLPVWKKAAETSWLSEPPSQVLQQSLKDLDAAFKNFFEGRAAYPVHKKKGKSRDAFRFPQGVVLDSATRRVFLPKIGLVRYRKSREIQGKIKSATVSRQGEHWHVSILTERDEPKRLPKAAASAGIDVGVSNFLTLDDGTQIAPINAFKNFMARIAKVQQSMARKTKFSSNWHKEKRKLQKLHIKAANVRKDFLHKTSRALCNNHAALFAEDLDIQKMTASPSAKGPGAPAPFAKTAPKSPSWRTRLNRAVLDQGWGELFRQIEYKMDWEGGIFLKVDPRNTSRTCPSCGHCSAANRPSQAVFLCRSCGFTGHADHVAATNIARAADTRHADVRMTGLWARLACGSNGATLPSQTGTSSLPQGKAPLPPQQGIPVL